MFLCHLTFHERRPSIGISTDLIHAEGARAQIEIGWLDSMAAKPGDAKLRGALRRPTNAQLRPVVYPPLAAVAG
jgi:hypothetical protein